MGHPPVNVPLLIVALVVGLAIGIRLATWVHFRKLKHILCERCRRDFWKKYDDADDQFT